jgi:hypothetical protein
MKYALIGVAGVAGVVAAFASPVSAQAVIEDPGYCAQFYPNANCQNIGPGNPYTDGNGRNDWPAGRHAFNERHARHRRHLSHHETNGRAG